MTAWGMLLLLTGALLSLQCAWSKPDPPRPGEVHPQEPKQPPPVLPEGYVRPDGTVVDPSEDWKAQVNSGGNQGRDRLLSAVYLADVATVNDLLAEEESGVLGPVAQVQVNRLEPTNNRNALMQCALDPQSNFTWKLDRNCTTIAKRLVGAGANISHVDKHGWNVIAFGAMKGFTKYIKYLLSKGGDVDNKDNVGRTPLMKAVTHGHVNTTHLLLDSGADVSAVDSHGWSVLHFSVRQLGEKQPNYVRIFELLMQFHNKATSETGKNTKAKMKSNKNNKKSRKFGFDAQDSDGRTALMYAALVDDNAVVSQLLEAGADPTVEDKQGMTAYRLCKTDTTRIQIAQGSADWATRQHKKWLQDTEARNPHLNKETCPVTSD